jgi:hypothetical protein
MAAWGAVPIGPATNALVVPPGVWTWRADRGHELVDAAGNVVRIPPDTALVGPHGLFIHGRGTTFTVAHRTADGARIAEPRPDRDVA